MSLLMFDGFESYKTGIQVGQFGPWKNLPYIKAGYARTGGAGVSAYPSYGLIDTMDFADPVTMFIGSAVKRSDSGAGNWDIFRVYGDGGEVLCEVSDGGANGYATIAKGDGSIIGTLTQATVSGEWRYMELKVVVSATVGRIELRINGAEVFNSGDIDIVPGTSTGVRFVRFGPSSTTANDDVFFDDVYICDDAGTDHNTFLGPVRVYALTPTGDVTKAWTPSTGTDNFAMVDDGANHDADSTYIASNTLDAKDIYTLSDLPAEAVSPSAVSITVVGRKDDTSGTAAYAGILKSGVTEVETATKLPDQDYVGNAFTQWVTDPDSGTAWDTTKVNALEIGAIVKGV